MTVEAQAAPATPATGGRFAAATDALHVRDFRLLWLNSLTFFLGRSMQMVAVSWLVLDITDSAALVGAALFAQGLPLALFSLPAGVWADRLDRRRLLVVSQTVSVVMTAVLTFLLLIDAVMVWQIFVIAFVMGTAMALGQPSRQALVPSLVGPERLMNAIVLNNLVQNLSFVIGPALAGLLLAQIGFGGTFVVQVGLLVAGLPWLLAMRVPPIAHQTERAPLMTELREGVSHVLASPLVRSLFIVTAFTGIFYVGTYQALSPVFARDILDVGALGLGFMNAAFGTGMFLGSIFIASRRNLNRKGEVLLVSLLTGALVFGVFAASRWFALSELALLAWGFGAAFFMNLTITLIQANTPDRVMGRVMSVQALCFYGVSPIGNLLGGVLAEVVSAPFAVVVSSVAVGVLAIWYLLRQPELRAAS
ncbi:MAG: MFS transporter [Dehalococcoidia bacterium]